MVLCVDVEPDARDVGLADPSWGGFERLLERMAVLREHLAGLGAPPRLTWFVRADEQVQDAHGDAGWAFERFAAELAGLRAHGDEIALHVHAWRRQGEQWIADHGDSRWVARCVARGLDAYRRAFGQPPRSYRGGDRFLSEQVLELLEQAGVAAEATVEPRMPGAAGIVDGERATGSLPDYRRAPAHLYRPRRGDFLDSSPPSRALTMIPLTPGGPETLYPWMHPPQFAERLYARALEPDLTHLAFALRSDLALDDEGWARTVENVNVLPHVIASALDRRVRFVTAGELARAASRRVGSPPR